MDFPSPFASNGVTEQEKNADLAIYLLTYLEQKRDPHEHIWLGDQPLRTVQFTCHSLEALRLLDLAGITDRLAEPAADWLLNLPLEYDLPPEERRALRIYPSRFKTLALLGWFDSDRVRADLAELTHLLSLDTGWIHDAPFTLNRALTTMIWVDTVFHLEVLGLIQADLLSKRERALQTIATAFEDWAGKALAALGAEAQQPASLPRGLGLSRPGEIANSGDASYALHLLIRSGRLSVNSSRVDAVRQSLAAAVRGRRLGEMRHTDLLYCGIHLRTHFPGDAEARDVVEAFIAELRERYQNNESQREPTSFHALVLRLLVVHHGEQLRRAVLEKLWLRSREAGEAQQRLEQEQLERTFVDLIRRSIHIYPSQAQPITGTTTRGEVYRLRFGLKTEATDEHGAVYSLPRDSLRLIVKTGPPDVLARARERYRELPESLQRLFARHASDPEEREPAPGYLIMQDLADMQPLSEILEQLDRPVLGREEREKIAAAADTVATLMQALHGSERRQSVVGHQFEVIYLTSIVDCLNRLCQPLAFPELKQWIEGTLEANGWTYRRFDWHLNRLIEHGARLRPTWLGYTHGDCHSRNVMLSRDLSRAKFVDLETLSKAEDYVVDYGLLIEDVAVYESLRVRGGRNPFDWDSVLTTRPENPTNTLDNWITYPAFPRRWEVDVLFQRAIIEHLREYAAGIGDKNWKERLWLSIARGLFMLGARQLTSHTVEPKRRRDGLKLVQVAYAEAIRLLGELVDHLMQKGSSPLPELPFPGERREPPRSPETGRDGRVAELLEAISAELGQRVERGHASDKRYFIDYFARPDHLLFARVHARSNAPVLYLACRVDQLHDPYDLVQPVAEGVWGVRIPLTRGRPMGQIMALIRQAYQLAIAPGGRRDTAR